MANFVKLKGTDSISTNRITINNNFDLVNVDLGNLISKIQTINTNISQLENELENFSLGTNDITDNSDFENITLSESLNDIYSNLSVLSSTAGLTGSLASYNFVDLNGTPQTEIDKLTAGATGDWSDASYIGSVSGSIENTIGGMRFSGTDDISNIEYWYECEVDNEWIRIPLESIGGTTGSSGDINGNGTITLANQDNLVSISDNKEIKSSGILASKIVRVNTAQTFTAGEQTQARDNIQALQGLADYTNNQGRFVKFSDNLGNTEVTEMDEFLSGSSVFIRPRSGLENIGLGGGRNGHSTFLRGGTGKNGPKIECYGNLSATNPGEATLEGVGDAEVARWDANNFKITSTTGALILNSYTNVKTDIASPIKGMVSLDDATGVPAFYDGTNWKDFAGNLI